MSTNNSMTSVEMLTQGSELKVAKPAASSDRLSDAEIKALARGMIKFLREGFAPEMMEKFVEPLLNSRERKLEARIRELEQRPLLEDAGIWNRSSEYHPGMVVTHDGSAWVAKILHAHGEPGKSDAWRLLVKRGRDGRDSR
jgi:hypothetical protein